MEKFKDFVKTMMREMVEADVLGPDSTSENVSSSGEDPLVGPHDGYAPGDSRVPRIFGKRRRRGKKDEFPVFRRKLGI